MIDFLDKMSLDSDEMQKEVEFFIPHFLPKGLITVYYADGGNGKTWLSYSVAAYLCENRLSKMVYYIDLDNSMVSLKERKVDELLMNRYENLKYLYRGKITDTPIGLLEKLAHKARSREIDFEDITLILDSLRDFTDIKNDAKALYMMSLLKDIRDAGATIACIAHSNKDGKNYEGSLNIRNSCDVMFRLTQIQRVMGEYIIVNLEARKERSGIKDCDFKIDTKSLKLSDADPVYSRMNEFESEIVAKGKEALRLNPDGLNQTNFMKAVGYDKTHTTARATIKKFEDVFWSKIQEKTGAPITYVQI